MAKRTLREWDLFQLRLARLYSTMSKDPSTKVGAVVCDKDSKHVFGLGYNGLPSCIADTDDILYNREKKYELMHHAEDNAIVRASGATRGETDGLTIVIYPFTACSLCAEEIIACGIARVVTLDYAPKRWLDNFKESERMLKEAGVEVVKYQPFELDHGDVSRYTELWTDGSSIYPAHPLEPPPYQNRWFNPITKEWEYFE